MGFNALIKSHLFLITFIRLFPYLFLSQKYFICSLDSCQFVNNIESFKHHGIFNIVKSTPRFLYRNSKRASTETPIHSTFNSHISKPISSLIPQRNTRRPNNCEKKESRTPRSSSSVKNVLPPARRATLQCPISSKPVTNGGRSAYLRLQAGSAGLVFRWKPEDHGRLKKPPANRFCSFFRAISGTGRVSSVTDENRFQPAITLVPFPSGINVPASDDIDGTQ